MGTPAVRSRIAAARGRYLDEFERRAPGGFQGWMSADAAESLDPGRYLSELTEDGPDRDPEPPG